MRPPNVSNGFIVDMKKVGFVKLLFHAIILNTLLEQALRPSTTHQDHSNPNENYALYEM